MQDKVFWFILSSVINRALSLIFLKYNPIVWIIVCTPLPVSYTHLAVKFIDTNFDEAIKITAEDTGLTEKEVLELYPLYDFNSEIKESDIKDLVNTQEFLLENGLQEKKIDIVDILIK